MIMKKAVSIAVLLAVCSTPGFACDKPSAPASIPDGKTASKDEMLASKRQVDDFKQGMEEYMSCEKNESKVDSAQEELERVASRFNAQVRAFKAKEG
jgi:hypothetical protein